jgi:5-dehydro-2-deoxygluconokinase
VIIGTREEFDMMEQFAVHQHDDEKTAQKWFDYHAKIVVIKHGKDGSIAYTKTGETFVGTIFPANIVKTFGAGDSYAAGFIYGLMNGWPIPKAMEYGAAAASIVISSHSCSDAMPTLDQIEQFIQQHKSSSTAAKS